MTISYDVTGPGATGKGPDPGQGRGSLRSPASELTSSRRERQQCSPYPGESSSVSLRASNRSWH